MKKAPLVRSFFVWSPRLGGEVANKLAIQLVPLSTTDKNTPRLRAIIASDGKTNHWIVPTKHIAAFLQQHANTHFVFEDIGDDFWAIHRLLRERCESAARLWKRRLATGRFSSVPLFDQLLRLATSDGNETETLQRRTLQQIAEDAGIEANAIQIDRNQQLNGVAKKRLKHAAEKATLLLQTYRYLQRRAKKIVHSLSERRSVRTDAVQRFGFLTEHLQAAAEASLVRVSQLGVRVDQAGRRKLHEQLEQEQMRTAGLLQKLVPGLLVESGDGFKLTNTGKICRRDAVLDEFLDHTYHQARRHDRSLEMPTTQKGNISRSPRDWQPLARTSPALRQWSELERVQSRLQFLPQLDQQCLHPQYTTLVRTGRTSCSNPPLQGLPRDGGIRELIVARPGYAFLTIDCQCFELAALAAICRHRYGKSRLAEILESGRDPHAWTAARLASLSDSEFKSLRSSNPRRYETLRQQAKAVNFGVPGGMSAAGLAEYCQTAFDRAMTPAAAQQFRERLLNGIYPELRQYLDEAGDTAVTLSGRIRTGISYTQSCNTLFQGLAADAAKSALTRLVAKGRRLVLFVHDEFVLEVPWHRTQVERAMVATIVKEIEFATSEIIGLPVRCDYYLSTCWSKQAIRKKEVGDWLSVWSL